MFQAPFSFKGRIRRTEFFASIVIYSFSVSILFLIEEASNSNLDILVLFMIPLLWFFWAQGAKRCHDLGNSGWYQLFPFYGFWLLFAKGEQFDNAYGPNPYPSSNVTAQVNPTSKKYSTTDGYSGGYNGGHNASGNNQPANPANIPNQQNNSKTSSGEYQSGNLYN